jgi:hypothetical protein
MRTFLGAVAPIDRHLVPPHLGFPGHRGGAVLLSREVSIPRKTFKALPCIPLFLLVCVTPGSANRQLNCFGKAV